MKRKIQMQFLLIILICLFVVSPGWGQTIIRKKITGIVHEKYYLELPSNLSSGSISKAKTGIICEDLFSGKLLACPYTHEVTGMKEPYEGSDDTAILNNGGHTHDYDTRPYFYPADGELYNYNYDPISGILLNGLDLDEDKKRVASNTYAGIGLIHHDLPEVGGRIVTETIITAPDGWECSWGCFTIDSWKYQTTLDIAVYENKYLISIWGFWHYIVPLMELPDPGEDDHYVKCRSEACPDPVPGTSHPEGHRGTSNTIGKLKQIAEELYDDTNRTLSINDISLPKGGLFDYDATWAPPHHTHRAGADADINTQGIKCYNDKELRNAVEAVSGGVKAFPYLQCEIGGKRVGMDNEGGYAKHIDFDDADQPVYYDEEATE